ncbi:NAD(P)H-binding protein [Flavobacterium amniphilum]|uniref:NAD(P)H-binding protein n=1 Tax=Flavobacterium amniphilum TaxID=1834035 RepID=UPI002029D4EF|nr:NAD(P)H-binding protein [Flavobacterium amniphilum]MCL9807426.1 NAD(P)H-binding protein [Flavobacterium amniphilum]
MKALIIGASGATGKDLAEVLLQDPDYTEVVTFVRRKSGSNHPKLTEIVIDFDYPETVSQFITGDVLFSCLGTTLKIAGTKEKQTEIDYGIPLRFASIAKNNNVKSLVLLSAYGASPSSTVFYSRIKGELERDIETLGFSDYTIFRPGLLLRKDSDRFGEKISAAALHFMNKLGILKSFKPMPTQTLAEKLALAPKTNANRIQIIELDKIFSFNG